jgi:hypothetical protein
MAQLRSEHIWWVRDPAGDYLPPVALDRAGNPTRLSL